MTCLTSVKRQFYTVLIWVGTTHCLAKLRLWMDWVILSNTPPLSWKIIVCALTGNYVCFCFLFVLSWLIFWQDDFLVIRGLVFMAIKITSCNFYNVGLSYWCIVEIINKLFYRYMVTVLNKLLYLYTRAFWI